MLKIKVEMSKKLLLFFALTLFLFCASAGVVSAQDAALTGVAISTTVKDTDVPTGSIICSEKDGYALCAAEYSASLYGVSNDTPALAVDTQAAGTHLVVTSGNAKVRVTSEDGDIKVGDFITSSTTPGVGKLATKNGYVLGIAQEDYSSGDKTAVGEITVSISIHPTIGASDSGTNLLSSFRQGLFSASISPLATLRYFLAAAMVIAGFVLGFIYFGRIAKAGVEAIGRNPLSSATIEAGLILHIILTIVIVGAGVGIAYMILVL